MDFFSRNREAIIAAIVSGLITAALLASLKFLLGVAELLGPMIAALGPWLLISVCALVVGVSVAFVVSRRATLRTEISELSRERDAAMAKADEWKQRANPPTLRSEVFRRVGEMRRFAAALDANPQDFYPLPKSFWDKFPFAEYQGLQDRMILALGNNWVRVSKFMPSRIEAIQQIANELEREALLIPSDMLL